MKEIEKIIEQTNASMAMESMPLTNEDKDRIRGCIGNERKVEETIATLIKKHMMPKLVEHEQKL